MRTEIPKMTHEERQARAHAKREQATKGCILYCLVIVYNIQYNQYNI